MRTKSAGQTTRSAVVWCVTTVKISLKGLIPCPGTNSLVTPVLRYEICKCFTIAVYVKAGLRDTVGDPGASAVRGHASPTEINGSTLLSKELGRQGRAVMQP